MHKNPNDNGFGDRLLRGVLYTLFATDYGLNIFSYGSSPTVREVKGIIQTAIAIALSDIQKNEQAGTQYEVLATIYGWLLSNTADATLTAWLFAPRSLRQGVLEAYKSREVLSETSDDWLSRVLRQVQRRLMRDTARRLFTDSAPMSRNLELLKRIEGMILKPTDEASLTSVFRVAQYLFDGLVGCFGRHPPISQSRFSALYLYTLITSQKDTNGQPLVKCSQDLKRINPQLHALFYTVLDLAQVRGPETAGLPARGANESYYDVGEVNEFADVPSRPIDHWDFSAFRNKNRLDALESKKSVSVWVVPADSVRLHICCRMHYFRTFTPLSVDAGPSQNTATRVMGIGTAVVTLEDDLSGELVELILRDCLYMPHASCNVISIAALRPLCEFDSNAIEIQFDEGDVHTIPPRERIRLKSLDPYAETWAVLDAKAKDKFVSHEQDIAFWKDLWMATKDHLSGFPVKIN